MTIKDSSLPPPVINKEKPKSVQQPGRPTQTAWLSAFKRLLKVPNTRYAFLWITGGLLFSFLGKRAIKRREEELMIEDIENYLRNKKN
jgi:hypothetical protein